MYFSEPLARNGEYTIKRKLAINYVNISRGPRSIFMRFSSDIIYRLEISISFLALYFLNLFTVISETRRDEAARYVYQIIH